MNFVSYKDLAKDVLELVPFCIEKKVSAIYGVPRSGMAPATMLATALGLPLGMPGREPTGGDRIRGRKPQDGPALLLEDSVYRGGGLRAAAARMGPCLKAAVYVSPESVGLVDAWARLLPGPRVFEWNVFGCAASSNFMLDFDGVLCHDPAVFDDDGPKYEAALVNAVPKLLPTWAIGWIATNRIERWRAITETWLAKHGVKVRNDLFMQPFETAAERRKRSTPWTFKARCYEEQPTCQLFVESHDRQAREIHALTGKPVLAIETMRMYQG